LRTAAESEADLIVMGTHGLHGWRRLLAGSVAESLLRGADRPAARAAGLTRGPSRRAAELPSRRAAEPPSRFMRQAAILAIQ
ncbi:universal stress protein, partial [Burkholderia gladioli]|uniref:universal stress protein n=1 Tax=Burkholderia gladioli TaxID=28095 RepID=UPI001FC8E524